MILSTGRSFEQGVGNLVGSIRRPGPDLEQGLTHAQDRTRISVTTAQFHSHLIVVAMGASP